MPTRLHRVQHRRVRREVFELKPVGVCVLEIRCRRVVCRAVIPQHDYLAAVVMMKLREIENEVLEPRRTFKNRETKLEKMTTWSSRDKTDARVIVTSGRFKNDRRFADRCPGTGAIRDERETAFIRQNKVQTMLVRFFLIRGQTCFFQ